MQIIQHIKASLPNLRSMKTHRGDCQVARLVKSFPKTPTRCDNWRYMRATGLLNQGSMLADLTLTLNFALSFSFCGLLGLSIHFSLVLFADSFLVNDGF